MPDSMARETFINANNIDPSNTAKFFQPTGVAEAGDGTLIVSDYGNHRVKGGVGQWCRDKSLWCHFQ